MFISYQTCVVAIVGEDKEERALEFLRKVHGQVRPLAIGSSSFMLLIST